MMHVNVNLSVIILYISKMPSSFLNVLQKIMCYAYDQVPFSTWWVPEQTQEHHLVLLGLMLVSLCALLPLLSLHWL